MPDENDFPKRIDFKNDTGFAHSFHDLAIQAFRDKSVTLEFRQSVGHVDYAPITFSLSDPNNAFTKEFLKLDESVRKAVTDDAELQDLLKKPDWSKSDRFLWEARVNDIVVEKMNESYLFKFENYTTSGPGTGIRNLNNMQVGMEYDCEAMSLIKGLMTQRVEDISLMTNKGGGLKQAYPYYYVRTNDVNFSDMEVSGHATVFCPALGNISDQKSIMLNGIEDYTFEDFKNSKPIAAYAQYADGSIRQASALSGMSYYSNEINFGDCAERNGKRYLSTKYQGVADSMSDFVTHYNTVRNAAAEAREAFLLNTERMFDDGVLSNDDIIEIGIAVGDNLKTGGLGERALTAMELTSIRVENNVGSDDFISYSNQNVTFEGFSDDVPAKKNFTVPLPKQ